MADEFRSDSLMASAASRARRGAQGGVRWRAGQLGQHQSAAKALNQPAGLIFIFTAALY
ncbi:hypothetical protein [Massilia frigida]|uniref:hypothetical protein n=1 Tax=Massilia frigida TaxID=2609281 RepID=UPI00141EA67D|nr:hypothetical protein [Massilia frigida]